MPADQGFSLHCWPAISRQLAEEIGTAKLFREHHDSDRLREGQNSGDEKRTLG